MFNLIHYFPELRTFSGAPEFKGTPQESNAYYTKNLTALWLSHAAYPMFDGVTQGESLINIQPERTWGQTTSLLSQPAYLLKTFVRPCLCTVGALQVYGDGTRPRARLGQGSDAGSALGDR
jgi:hypothetical protein